MRKLSGKTLRRFKIKSRQAERRKELYEGTKILTGNIYSFLWERREWDLILQKIGGLEKFRVAVAQKKRGTYVFGP